MGVRLGVGLWTVQFRIPPPLEKGMKRKIGWGGGVSINNTQCDEIITLLQARQTLASASLIFP